MKVFISGDIEGVSGLVSWSQCGRPDSNHFDYRWARERYTADINAAIRGARNGGATDITVKDSHGNSKNLLLDDLEPGVKLISGHGSTMGGMMAGLDSTYDVAFLVGYHAMAGTQAGVMEHTITGQVHRMWINDYLAGEIGLSAGVAGCFNVPVVFVSSDEAGCKEARELIPGIETTAVKRGMGRYMAECLPVDLATQLIEEQAARSLRNRIAVEPWLPSGPVTIRVEFNRSEEADQAARLPMVKRLDAYTLEVTSDLFSDAHAQIWSVILFATMGSVAQS